MDFHQKRLLWMWIFTRKDCYGCGFSSEKTAMDVDFHTHKKDCSGCGFSQEKTAMDVDFHKK